jgi:AraC family transcriptional regulator, positive regulator of tynA and feaB
MPPRLWSTEEVEQHRALAYWIDTVCDRFMELEIDTPVRDRFHARLEQADLGPVTVNILRADRQRVCRTRAKIAGTHHPVFHLMQMRSGSVVVHQLGRATPVRPGECVLINGTEPYEIECPDATNALVLGLPERWLKRWLRYPERFPARAFSGRGWTLALNAALESLELGSTDALALPANAVAEQLASLLALAVGPEALDSRPALLERAMRTLQVSFHEPDLDATAVASLHNVSLRALHYAFAHSDTTFAEELFRLRLEHARQMLSDPKRSRMPMIEVAARSGFGDPSHFSRRFRQRYGQSPRQFRKASIRLPA